MKDLETESFQVTFLGDFSKKFVTNTLFNVLGRSWNFLTNLFLTPYILSKLNVGDFGVWVLLTIFISSVSLLDLGLGFSFVRYVSAYHTHEDYDRINKVIFSGLAFYGLLGILGIAVGLLIEGPLLALFNIGHAADVYLLILVTCAVSNIGAMFLSVFKGIQRMDRQNSLEIAISVMNVVGTVVFLEAGFGIFGLAVNALLNAFLAVCLTFVTLKRV